MLIEIKNRFSGSVLFSHDVEENKLKISLMASLKAGSNLSDADLSDANLSGADLRDAKIDGEEITISPLSITGLIWRVLITDNYLRIGCKRHTHSEWFNFSDDEIKNMDSRASAFWSDWKVPLLEMCAAHASKVTPIESKESA